MNKAEVFFLNRYNYGKKQTLGKLVVMDAALDALYQCEMLELPDKDNARNISCIPEGIYTIKKRHSKKYGWHFHVLDVPGRSYVLIHFGNYYTDTRGCLLPGQDLVDINNDGLKDVTNSKATMRKLLELAPDELKLQIAS